MDKEARADRIEAAAYAVLAQKGYKGASMLAIAKAAKASNETLYKWYGDKTGLFAQMIKSNTSRVEAALLAARQEALAPPQMLTAIGCALLEMVTAPNAIALNRAAAGDVTGQLGPLIAAEGRDKVMPIFATTMAQVYGADAARSCAEDFVTLLIGDLQIRRAIGALDPLDADQVQARTARAVDQFLTLHPCA